MPNLPDLSQHARVRMQQRCVPPLIIDWLHRYGAAEPAGGDAEVLYFDKRAKQRLARDVGGQVVSALGPMLNAFAVCSAHGLVITAGWRTDRILRERTTGRRTTHARCAGRKGARA